MRLALYWTPPPDDALARAAARWLGRDAFTGASHGSPVPAEDTRSARRYGFHATLKPPFAPAAGWDCARVTAAARGIVAAHAPFALPPLRPTMLGSFLALALTAACPPLDRLAADLVTGLDPARRPPDPAETARRRTRPLSAAEDANLARWGYPHVLDTWQFHMTLSDALPRDRLAALLARAQAHFAGVLDGHRVSDVRLFVEAAPGQDFLARTMIALRGTTATAKT